jgi:hypothetical protein
MAGRQIQLNGIFFGSIVTIKSAQCAQIPCLSSPKFIGNYGLARIHPYIIAAAHVHAGKEIGKKVDGEGTVGLDASSLALKVSSRP